MTALFDKAFAEISVGGSKAFCLAPLRMTDWESKAFVEA
jgi:hypothetical protein